MARDKLINNALCEWQNEGITLYEMLDKIFIEAESRVCINCEYYEYFSTENGKTKCATPYYVCACPIIDADGGYFQPPSDIFGCNEFIRKAVE